MIKVHNCYCADNSITGTTFDECPFHREGDMWRKCTIMPIGTLKADEGKTERPADCPLNEQTWTVEKNVSRETSRLTKDQ